MNRGDADRERFEIRRVDHERRAYVYVSDDRRFHDACIGADLAVALYGYDVVIWDRHEKRLVYDSRGRLSPPPPSNRSEAGARPTTEDCGGSADGSSGVRGDHPEG